ncbi:MAG: STT3 domain-containing protein [Nanoarchaeota archaeon]|nr:STT3 domain-containing protein [Nanoarchaeota archaeon]
MAEDDIDFSKLKAWFKKKADALNETETQQKTVQKERTTKTQDSNSPDDLAIDFSKVKSVFRNLLKPEQKTEEIESVDFSSLKAGMAKAKRGILHPVAQVVLLLALVLGIGIWLRAIPANVPLTETWAENYLENAYVQQVAAQIQAQYPTLPAQNIETQARQQFASFKRDNRAQFDENKKAIAAQFRDHFQLEGQTYLTGIDPEYWMLHARNIIENGHPGDTLRNPVTREECVKRSNDCVPWDDHMYAPLGREVPPDMFHAYVAAYAHKMVALFSPRTTLLTTMFYLPVLLGALCALPAFFIARKISGNFGGFTAGVLVGIHPALLSRTVGGFADTDAYNVLFPLLILWMFLAASRADNWKKALGLSTLSGLLFGLYPRVWSGGWWYVGAFIVASGAVALVLNFRAREKGSLMAFAGFVVSGVLFIALFSGIGTLANLVSGPLEFIHFKDIGTVSIWPNVFTTVAEQTPASLPQVISNISFNGVLYLLVALLGFAGVFTKKEPDKEDLWFILGSAVWFLIVLVAQPSLLVFIALVTLPFVVKTAWMAFKKQEALDLRLGLILLLWFCATVYASTRGVRYLLLLVPVFALGIGICFGMLSKKGGSSLARALHLNENLAKWIVVVLLLLMLLPPFAAAKNLAGNSVPLMNDAWYNALDKINQESSPDAIITSWWDYGHWYKNIADRAVTFDGTSQNSPMAHWVGKALLTSNESEAVGILRMLDCGSTLAFDRLDAKVQDSFTSVRLIQKIVALDKEDARAELLTAVDAATADDVLRFTHCEPPQAFFITSDDLIAKAPVWGHFGSWDFGKALLYQQAQRGTLTPEFVKERLGVSDEEAKRLVFEARGLRTSSKANDWIAPWPQFASGLIACANLSSELLQCPLNTQTEAATIQINLTSGEAGIRGMAGILHPDAVTIPSPEGRLMRKEYGNQTLGYAMVLVPGDRWAYILMDAPLDQSLFTRLYFFGGRGLEHFNLFTAEASVNGNRVMVWNVDWQGNATGNAP